MCKFKFSIVLISFLLFGPAYADPYIGNEQPNNAQISKALTAYWAKRAMFAESISIVGKAKHNGHDAIFYNVLLIDETNRKQRSSFAILIQRLTNRKWIITNKTNNNFAVIDKE